MKTKVTFGSIGKADHLEAFVLERTEEAVRDFLKAANFHLEVHLATECARTSSRRPYFKCEIFLQVLGRKHSIVVRKFSANFYEAVLKAEHALRKILRRDAACKPSLRKEKWHAYVVDDQEVA